MAKRTVSYRETIAIRGFLSYIHDKYSRKISTTDTYLIAAISAWLHVESGGLAGVRYNNPFNLRGPSPVRIDPNTGRKAPGTTPGPLLRFASLSKGFEAAAAFLIQARTAYGYQLALNALKRGGNEAAVDFLAALAMSHWDGGHYGAYDWISAYDQKQNVLIKAYTQIAGVQLRDPNVKQKQEKPVKPLPKLPRDLNYIKSTRTYLDPWAAGTLYEGRHRRRTVDVSGTTR